jgi:hypothetical protein
MSRTNMNTPTSTPPPTRELPIKDLPACRCGKQQSGNWPTEAQNRWLLVKAAEAEQKEPGLVEYECLSCRRRYRVRETRLFEVLPDGSERAYMRQGQYGRWLSCR